MRNRIWAEITDAKHNAEFSSLYADFQRRNLRIFNIGILIFSSGGVMGWPIWNMLPLISCILISLVSLIRLLQPQLIMTERQIGNLDKIAAFYQGYLNKLEKLWYESEYKNLFPETVKDKFFKLKDSEAEIYPVINDTVRSKPKRIVRKATAYSALYFEHTFKTRYNAKRNAEHPHAVEHT